MYSIFTTLIFIIVAVLIVIGGMFLGGKIALVKSYTGSERFKTSLAESAMDELTACHKQEVLDERAIPRCLSSKYAKATRIIQPPTTGCEPKSWGNDGVFASAKDLPQTELFTYWLGVQQYGKGTVCLAQAGFVI